MGCGGGGGGTNTVTQNSAPPQWLQNNLQSLYSQAQSVTGQPLQQYPAGTNASNLVAGFNPTQEQAFNIINQSQGMAQPLYNQAQQLITNASQPIIPQTVNAADISQYQNPYTQQVIGTTEQQLQQNDAIQQQQLESGAIQSGSSPFGGDRAGIAAAALAGQQDLANNQTIAGLENQGYTQALGEANTQQQVGVGAQEASQYLGQQGGFGLTNLGTTSQNEALQGASAQLQSGGLGQQLAQEQLNVPYEQYLQQQAYPYQNLSALEGAAGIAGGLSGGTSSTTSPGPSTASQLGGLGLAGLAINQALPSGYGLIAGLGALGLKKGGVPSYNRGGFVPHYDMGGNIILPNIPDVSMSYVTGNNNLNAHSSIPQAPHSENANSSQNNPMGFSNISSILGGAKGIGGLIGQNSSGNPLGLSAGPNFSQSDIQALTADFDNGFGKGGIAHYDDGGMVGGLAPASPSENPLQSQNINQKLAQMTPQQLQQLQMKLPPQSPQGQIIQKALQQKRMMPNVGQGIAAGAPQGAMGPTPQMKKGGLLPHYDDGGNSPDEQMSPALVAADNAATPMPQVLPSLDNSAPADYLTQLTGGSKPKEVTPDHPAADQSDKPAMVSHEGKTVTVDTNEGKLDLGIPSQKDNFNTALLTAGLGIMAGTSPHALTNIGAGGLKGVQTYNELQQQGVKDQQAQQQLKQTGAYQTGTLQDAQQRLAEESRHNTADESLRARELAQQATNQTLERQNQALQLNKPEFDKMGNPWFRDASSPTGWTKATGNTLGANQNIYGYDIGSVPQGTSAPVIDPKFDPTIGMDVTRKSINAQKTQDQLEKDNAAAAINNDSIARLQASKGVITSAPTGGVTNFLGIGPVADAFSTQRQELNALNKELALAPGERPQNMRITQGEVFMLKQAQPGVDKSPEANAAIADANIAIRTRPSEFANFKNDFVANNGYWNDAIGQQMYNKYIQDNPIIDVKKSGNGQIVLNPNRQTIEQYANNGGFAKYGVKGNPQANQQSTATQTTPKSQSTTASSSGAVVPYTQYFQ